MGPSITLSPAPGSIEAMMWPSGGEAGDSGRKEEVSCGPVRANPRCHRVHASHAVSYAARGVIGSPRRKGQEKSLGYLAVRAQLVSTGARGIFARSRRKPEVPHDAHRLAGRRGCETTPG